MTSPNPSGRQSEISSDGYSATITEVGASLRVLRHGSGGAERDLVTPWPADVVRPVHRGALLAPWPNRVGDGRYPWAGRELQLDLSEVPRRTAIHGLVAWAAWEVAEQEDHRVVLTHRIWPSGGYPFLLDLSAEYALGPGGLTTTVTATNAGTSDAPYGCAPHPYLVAGPGRVDDWTVALPASAVLEVDAERLLPADPPATRTPDGDLDLTGPTRLGPRQLDHAYTGLPVGEVEAVVTTADSSGVRISWDSGVLPWVQVHTADRPEPALDRVGLAVEPMTCPPDAFRSGTDLVVLAPGDTHTASWTIGAVPRDGGPVGRG